MTESIVRLPLDVQHKLQELELELAEGDITQKGFEKKRIKLLEPYRKQKQKTDDGRLSKTRFCPYLKSIIWILVCTSKGESPVIATSNHKHAKSRIQCRRQKHEGYNRYHSDVRQEAVKQALEQYGSKPISSSKRISNTQQIAADLSSDDESLTYTTDDHQSPFQQLKKIEQQPQLPELETLIKNIPAPSLPPPIMSSFLSDFIHRSQEPSLSSVQPDLTRSAGARYRDSNSDYINNNYQHYVMYGERTTTATQQINQNTNVYERKPSTRVSSKILALVNTLKRPKRKQLHEFFEDNEEELAMPPIDPLSPKPEGGISVPSCGEQLVVSSQWPKNFIQAINQHGINQGRNNFIVVLDEQGKAANTLTFIKLMTRSHKIAFNLLNKVHCQGSGSTSRENLLKSGDRVALVYSNNDPINFICAFYGCIIAGIVPLPVDVPLSRRDWLSQRIGILLGQLGVKVALTSESCYRQLPKTNLNSMSTTHSSTPTNTTINGHHGDILSFKGWPPIVWFVTEHLQRLPKDWTPPLSVQELQNQNIPAYIEYSSLKDGSVVGVTVTHEQLLIHSQTLINACKYTSSDICLCCVDFKREVGLWHSVHA
ncbi:unnamed protein product, partial [Didymodactylos carnosus]